MFANTGNYTPFPEGYKPVFKNDPERQPVKIKVINKKPNGKRFGGVYNKKQSGGAMDTPSDITEDITEDIPVPSPPSAIVEPDQPVGVTTTNLSDTEIDFLITGVMDTFKYGRELIKKPMFEGERHAVLRMPDGSYKTANFMGPGTNISARVKDPEGIGKPIVPTDAFAKRHDIMYYKAEDAASVRKADQDMMDSVAKSEKEGTDNKFNLSNAKLIAFKMKLEDWGVNPERFATFGGWDKLTADDRSNYETALADLVQQGYGTRWDDADVETFKIKQNPKPAERMWNELSGGGVRKKKSKRSKIPKKVRERILRGMEIEDRLNDQEIPENVRVALDGF